MSVPDRMILTATLYYPSTGRQHFFSLFLRSTMFPRSDVIPLHTRHPPPAVDTIESWFSYRASRLGFRCTLQRIRYIRAIDPNLCPIARSITPLDAVSSNDSPVRRVLGPSNKKPRSELVITSTEISSLRRSPPLIRLGRDTRAPWTSCSFRFRTADC
jgi:hypothetical protein